MANPIPDDKLREARAEAARQLANRERRDGLRAMFDALLRARDFLDEEDVVGDEAAELSNELQRINLEMKTYSTYVIIRPANGPAFDRLGKKCAPDGEGFDEALRRVLLERGASAYQVRDALYDGDDSERTNADRAKRARREKVSVVHAATARLVKRYLPTSSRAGWKRHGAELENLIGNLSVGRKTTPSRNASKKRQSSRSAPSKKNQSSSRKRR